MIKQVIVVRKDLNMRKGKIAGQAAHATMKVLVDRMTISAVYEGPNGKTTSQTIISTFTEEMLDWLKGIFTKIVVGCDSLDCIYDIETKCREKNIPCAIIVDSGATEFHGVPTVTCIAVGPADEKDIDPITGLLPLL
jgi:peptidyl-tRNA hydrolase, PTH2 family